MGALGVGVEVGDVGVGTGGVEAVGVGDGKFGTARWLVEVDADFGEGLLAVAETVAAFGEVVAVALAGVSFGAALEETLIHCNEFINQQPFQFQPAIPNERIRTDQRGHHL